MAAPVASAPIRKRAAAEPLRLVQRLEVDRVARTSMARLLLRVTPRPRVGRSSASYHSAQGRTSVILRTREHGRGAGDRVRRYVGMLVPSISSLDAVDEAVEVVLGGVEEAATTRTGDQGEDGEDGADDAGDAADAGEGAVAVSPRSTRRMPMLPRTIAAIAQGRETKKAAPELKRRRKIERGPRKTAARAGMLPSSSGRGARRPGRGLARGRGWRVRGGGGGGGRGDPRWRRAPARHHRRGGVGARGR